MPELSAETQVWLTKTIPGIVLLGAIGSLIGAVFWALVKLGLRWLFARHVKFLFLIMLPFGKRIEAAEALRDQYKNLSPAARYSLYFLFRATVFLMTLAVLLGLIVTTVLTFMVVQFAHPWLLVVMVALSFYFAYRLLKMYSYLDALQFREVEEAASKIERELPKSLSEWKKRIFESP